MAFVATTFKLDLTPGAARQVLYTSQGDIGRPFEADLYWNGSPWTATGTTANIRGKKPDDTVFDYTATVSGAAVTFETTEQMTIIPGPVECELVFTSGDDVVASANFVLIVEDSPYDPNNLSESEVEGLTDVLAGFQRLNRDSNGVVKIGDGVTASGTAEPIKGFYVHDEVTNTDGVAKYSAEQLAGDVPEVKGIRTGYDGTVYPSAGDAVKRQAEKTNTELYSNEIDYSTFVQGTKAYSNPTQVNTNLSRCTVLEPIVLHAGDVLRVTNNASGQKYAVACDSPSFDSGWQTGDFEYLAQDDMACICNIAYNDGLTHITPSDVTLQVEVIDNSSRIAENTSKIAENKDAIQNTNNYFNGYLFGDNIPMPFELGLVTYKNDHAWVYKDGNTMARTPANSLVKLYKGTKIGLSDYSDARFYVGWVKEDGTTDYSTGWKTSDYTVTEDGKYSLLVSNLTPRAQTSADALASLVKITPIDVYDRVLNVSAPQEKVNIHPAILGSKYIAHRGNDSTYPENTLPAFKWAIDSGYEIMEYDIRFTSDDVPVLIHDETINRTARNSDGTEVSETVYVADSTYQELLQYDFGIWKGSQFAGTQIMSLEDFLIFIKKYNVCGDTDWTAMNDALTDEQMEIFVNTVKKHGMLGSIMFTSNPATITRLLSNHSGVLACVANQDPSNTSTWPVAVNALEGALMKIVSLQYPYADKTWHDKAHDAGIYTKTFTPSGNDEINASLEFAPDLMIVGHIGRDQIVIDD